MPNTRTLTSDELRELTGYRQPSRQCRALAESGLRYIKRRDGSPAVTWDAVTSHQLGSKPKPAQDTDGPNLNFLRRHGQKAQD
jgi:hypothetical protein